MAENTDLLKELVGRLSKASITSSFLRIEYILPRMVTAFPDVCIFYPMQRVSFRGRGGHMKRWDILTRHGKKYVNGWRPRPPLRPLNRCGY